MKTNLLVCPNCLDRGKKEVLGEFNDDGSFEVLRFRDTTTKIVSGELEIKCGVCGDTVFFRVKKNGLRQDQGGQERLLPPFS